MNRGHDRGSMCNVRCAMGDVVLGYIGYRTSDIAHFGGLAFPRRVTKMVPVRVAGVAQLVEHHVANVVVVGSNPITRFHVSRSAGGVFSSGSMTLAAFCHVRRLPARWAAGELSGERGTLRMAKGLQVLLVEDHDLIAEMMVQMLRELGHKPTRAACVADAVGVMAKHPFSLIICDFSLPDGTAYDLSRTLSAGVTPPPPAILLTAYGNDSLPQGGGEMFVHRLEKPVASDLLDRTIRQLFS